jgi:branched-subunit amino acid ABC-type transport system permease component
MLQVVLFNVTNGLIIGAFYVLMALGLSLILNLSNVINFAHGNFLALGGYTAFVLTPYRLLGRVAGVAHHHRDPGPGHRAADDPPGL